MDYLKRIGVQLSCLLNVILGGRCHQTFSARNWEWKRQKKKNGVAIIDTLFYKDPCHCLVSWLHWIKRRK